MFRSRPLSSVRVFHYKIADYEIQLGNIDRAEEHIVLALCLDLAIENNLAKIDLQIEPLPF